MADVYYIRWRGQVSGPFSEAQARAMLADGKVSRHHQISTDGIRWQSMDQSELAAAAARPASPPGAVSASLQPSALQRITPPGLPQPAAKPKPLKVAAKAKPKGQAEVLDWLYVEGDSVMGPVSFAALRGLAESRVLDPDTEVSPDGDEDWRPLREVVPFGRQERPRHSAPQVVLNARIDPEPLPAANASVTAQHRVSNLAAMVFCRGCGKELHGSARACPHCGAIQRGSGQGKSKIVAGLLALFLGGLGIHRFYLGQWWGLLYLLFCWTFVPGVVALVEAIVFFCTSDAEWQARYG